MTEGNPNAYIMGVSYSWENPGTVNEGHFTIPFSGISLVSAPSNPSLGVDNFETVAPSGESFSLEFGSQLYFWIGDPSPSSDVKVDFCTIDFRPAGVDDPSGVLYTPYANSNTDQALRRGEQVYSYYLSEALAGLRYTDPQQSAYELSQDFDLVEAQEPQKFEFTIELRVSDIKTQEQRLYKVDPEIIVGTDNTGGK